jgi:eukaryotic-like serine/threonine-protein kinase
MEPIQANMEPIPGYRLISRLGRGGCGEVWKAEAPGGIPKAIKFVQGDLNGFEPGAAEQEQKSLHRVKSIRHPFVLSIERFDVVDGQLVIVMELADKNLHDRFAECQARNLSGIPRDELLRYMEEAAEALDLMSTQHQLQHLDVKPQNIFLVHQHVKVADFGLAKDLQGTRAALTGGMTPMYAPPETFDGWVSRQSDQYSLAIVYMEMLTGRRPFSGASTRQLIMQHLSAPPDLSPLPADDRPAVARALAKSPDERFLSCADFVRTLRTANSSAVTATINPTVATIGLEPKTDPLLRHRAPAVVPTSRPDTPNSAKRQTRSSTSGEFRTRPNGSERGRDPILFPVLVIGLGGTGLAALKDFRRLIHDRFGRPTVPNIRWLFVDTDPRTVEEALSGPSPIALATDEVLLTPPRSPADYQDRPELATIDTRLNLDTLGRLPATPATHGMRGLGRLALADHFVAVRNRIQATVTAFSAPDFLADALRMTGLGPRSSSPRVYMVGSLYGGTGSGMLIDLTFLVRRLLRTLRLSAEHIVGMLALPPSVTTGLAMPNARRALEDLAYHDRPDTVYECRLERSAEPVADAGRPFRRCALLPAAIAPALAAHLMYAETLTPLGRTVYPDRAAVPETPYSAIGLRRVLWPRDRLLAGVARQLARDTLAGWAGPSAAGTFDVVAKAVDREWAERRLDPALLRTGVEYGAAQKLSGPIDTLIQEIVPPPPSIPGVTGPDVATAGAALDRLVELFGSPGGDDHQGNGRVATALEARAADLGTAADARIVSLVVSLVEKPGCRVAAAREAVRLLAERLSAGLATVEQESAGLADESRAGFAALRELLVPPTQTGRTTGRKFLLPVDFSTRAAQWAKTRYRQLRDRAAGLVYRRLLATIPQLQIELGLVAEGLTGLARELGAPAEIILPADGVCEYLFPFGAGSFQEAADRLSEAFGEGTRREFDELVQSKLRTAGRGIIQIAVRPEESGPRLARVLRAEAERFVGERANRLSAAQALLRHFPERDDLQSYLRGLVESATPAAPNLPLTILGLSDDSSGQQVGDQLRKLCGDGQVLEARASDEIVVWRECRGISPSILLNQNVEVRPSLPVNVSRLSEALMVAAVQ